MTSPTRTGALTFSAIAPGSGLAAALSQTPSAVLGQIAGSGLRGRGGAGIPTSLKWSLAAEAAAQKYVVCNADEGEPGTFKDRVILTEFADLVFEGMTIAARVIAARHGIVYLRSEYTYLRPHLETVLARRRQEGLLGHDIAGQKGFDFQIDIHMGSGAYVCGEETAMIESLEGHRGEPRNRPPFPIDTGYLGRPTIVNNVETFAWVVCILARGTSGSRATAPQNPPATSCSACRATASGLASTSSPGHHRRRTAAGSGRRGGQGGAGGRGFRAVHPRRPLRPLHGVRGHVHRRLGHRLWSAARHAGRGRELPGVLRRRIVRPVHALPRGRAAADGRRPHARRGQCSMAYLKELCALGETLQVASKCGLGQSAPNALLSVVAHFQDEILGRTEWRDAPTERLAPSKDRRVT